MSYVRTNTALGVTRAQQTTLVESVTDEELAALDPETRLNLVLRRQEVKASESQARWAAISSFVIVSVPIATFLGLSFAGRKK